MRDDERASLREAVKTFKRRQYEQALPLLLPHARRGEVEACRALSRMYYAGHGVTADQAQYLYWLARAAENGDRAARAKLKRRWRAGDLPPELASDPYVSRLLRLGAASSAQAGGESSG